MFPIELFGVKSKPAKSARNLEVIFDNNFIFCSHIEGDLKLTLEGLQKGDHLWRTDRCLIESSGIFWLAMT